MISASTTHPKTIGTHKRMLKDLVVGWYQRRVARNVLGSKRLGIHEGVFTLPEGMPHVSEVDISFSLASVQSMKRDIAPHWWFAACVR